MLLKEKENNLYVINFSEMGTNSLSATSIHFTIMPTIIKFGI